VRTKLLIQREALRLFAQYGYEQTTIEQIAEAADISSSTFFRYFPTKEDVVVWDEWDAQTGELLAAHSGDQPVAQALCAITRATLEGPYTDDPERLLARLRVSASVPAIRARYLELSRTAAEQIASTMASDPEDQHEALRLRVTAAAIIDIANVALDQWQKVDGKTDLLALYDTTTTALIDSLNELKRDFRGQKK
jgi:AcrR family transcriptional regulator